jgi:hypothetical protein
LPESNGFIVVGLNEALQVHTVYDVIKRVRNAYGGDEGSRTCLVGYWNKEDITSEFYVVVIRPADYEDVEKMEALNLEFQGKRIEFDKWQPTYKSV